MSATCTHPTLIQDRSRVLGGWCADCDSFVTWEHQHKLNCPATVACAKLGCPPEELVECVRQTVGVLGLVLEAMRSGKPYWHGESLQGQVAAALALWSNAIPETPPEGEEGGHSVH